MSNPFEQNPWQQEPRCNNAYQSEGNPPYGNAYESNTTNPPTGGGFSSTGNNNAWEHRESNKTEYTANNNAWDTTPAHYQQAPSSPYASNNAVRPQPQQQDAYQYTGTPYGNQSGNHQANAYSQQTETSHHQQQQQQQNKPSAGPDPWNGEVYHTPNKWRFWFRFVLLLASIGHLGFAAGARPYSGQDVPFYTSACFYYLFAVAVLSIIWSAYHVFFYCYRRMLKKPKTNRPIMFALDLLMAVLWGIGVIVEVAKFRCTDGSKFCSFYNVSIFWGFVAFAGYIVTFFWDVLGGCRSRRK